MKASKESILSDSVQKYIESFDTPEELIADFIQYTNIPSSKGIPVFNTILNKLPNKFFSKIRNYRVKGCGWFDDEYIPPRILIDTNEGTLSLLDDKLLSHNDQLLYNREKKISVNDEYGYQYRSEERIDCNATYNLAQLIYEISLDKKFRLENKLFHNGKFIIIQK